MKSLPAALITILLNVLGLLLFQHWGRYAIDTLVDLRVDHAPCLSQPVQQEACDAVLQQFVLWNGVGFLLFTLVFAWLAAWAVLRVFLRRRPAGLSAGDLLRNYAGWLLIPVGSLLVSGRGDWLGLAAMVAGTLLGMGVAYWCRGDGPARVGKG